MGNLIYCRLVQDSDRPLLRPLLESWIPSSQYFPLTVDQHHAIWDTLHNIWDSSFWDLPQSPHGKILWRWSYTHLGTHLQYKLTQTLDSSSAHLLWTTGYLLLYSNINHENIFNRAKSANTQTDRCTLRTHFLSTVLLLLVWFHALTYKYISQSGLIQAHIESRC